MAGTSVLAVHRSFTGATIVHCCCELLDLVCTAMAVGGCAGIGRLGASEERRRFRGIQKQAGEGSKPEEEDLGSKWAPPTIFLHFLTPSPLSAFGLTSSIQMA